MNKRYTIITLAIAALFTVVAYAGLATGKSKGDDDKKKKSTIEKKIEITDENGVKTVTVTTTKDGKTRVETYTGEEADKYLEEQDGMSWHSSGNGNFHFQFDSDSIHGNMFRGFGSMNDSIWKQVEIEMKKAMEHLHESGVQLNMKLNGMNFDFDSVMTNGNMFRFYQFDGDEMDKAGKMLDSVLRDVDIRIEMDDKGEHHHKNPHAHARTRVIIAHSVEMKDVPAEKKSTKTPGVEDISFYPNPSEGDFTLRYESKNEDPIRISVKDVTGREVYAETVSALGIIKRQISLGDQPAGSYILNLQQGKKSISKKLIIH